MGERVFEREPQRPASYVACRGFNDRKQPENGGGKRGRKGANGIEGGGRGADYWEHDEEFVHSRLYIKYYGAVGLPGRLFHSLPGCEHHLLLFGLELLSSPYRH